jgi:hypothetical protein
MKELYRKRGSESILTLSLAAAAARESKVAATSK